MKVSKKDQAEAIARLRELLPPGATAYSVLRHVSRSGMQRQIDFYALDVRGRQGRPSLAVLLDLARAGDQHEG